MSTFVDFQEGHDVLAPPLKIVNAELRFPRVRLIEPSASLFIQQRADRLHIARFDLAVLIECDTAETVQRVQRHPACQAMHGPGRPHAAGRVPVRSLGRRRFRAEPRSLGLHSRWFEVGTALDNWAVLLPDDVLPSLLFKKTSHSCVLDNFAANNVAAMPVLYRLA